MQRPIINIPKSTFDYVLDWVIIACQILLVVIPIYYYSKLPEKIPTHFGLSGEPDSYGSKITIIILPLIALLTSYLLSYLVKIPHKYNYPVKINERNAFIQYSIATRMMRTLNAFITLSMLYITYSIIQSALGNMSGLGTGFVSMFIVITLIIVFIPIFQSTKYK